MKPGKLFILLVAALGFSDPVFSQNNPVKTDTSGFYRDIETFSKKKKFTKFIYGIFFKPVRSTGETTTRKKKKRPSRTYRQSEGKIIRNIFITTLDPFGNSVTDTALVTQHGLPKAGNSLHVKTQRIAIWNLLLIRENEPFDSLLVMESERLIRSQKYVRDVSFYMAPAGSHSDSVDVYIRELDTWSLIPRISISPSSFSGGITDRNFIGLGHEFQNDYSQNNNTDYHIFHTNYTIPNIKNTYINTSLHYEKDSYGNYIRSLNVDRPFFSPFAKWAAGAWFASQCLNDSIFQGDAGYVPISLKFGTQDYWAGISKRVFHGNTAEERVTNLILTARYKNVRYYEKPPILLDSIGRYGGEDFYFAGIGISNRNYFQDHYVFNFGVTEDVPYGKVLGLTLGYQLRNNSARTYAGIRFSFGNYHTWGYLSSEFEYGTFFRASHPEQGVFTAGVNYFTELLEIGKWKIRQFAKPQLTVGIHRFSYENLTINNDNGIRGFSGSALNGTQKLLLTLQTQSYAPWSLLGFRFGPYLICSFGMLGDETTGFTRSRIYSQFGIGVLIKNDYLVINHFQLSISFFPIIPGDGQNVFKLNSNVTTDFGFRDFSLGKPEIVKWQ